MDDIQAPESALNSCFFRHTIEVERHTSLKNTKLIARFGRRLGLRTAPKTKAAQDFLVLSLQERARDLHFDRPWGHALRVVWHLEFAAYWTKGKPIRLNRKAGDLSNAIQACEDALTKAGIIEDDSLIVEMRAKKIPSHRNAITVELFECASSETA